MVSLQSYGIKVGYGGIPGPSSGRDGGVAQGGGCCSWSDSPCLPVPVIMVDSCSNRLFLVAASLSFLFSKSWYSCERGEF